MTGDAVAFLVAALVPVATLSAVVGLIAGLRSLDRSRDELAELAPERWL